MLHFYVKAGIEPRPVSRKSNALPLSHHARKRVECRLRVVQGKGGGEINETGSVYFMKNRGPRTEPCRTPQEEVYIGRESFVTN